MAEFESARAENLSQFQLFHDDVQFLPVFPASGDSDRESQWRRRDELIMSHANTVLPVSVRSGGYLETLMESARREGKTVVDDFSVPYRRRRHRMAYRIFPESLNPHLTGLEGCFLIHWTRTANTAWPTERLIDFYRDVVSSEKYPRSAFHTLLNIVDTGIIVASSRHMPENIRTVSFSLRAPADMAPLFRWRARYREMSFEPYGLGIERDTAAGLGIRPVRYAGSDITVRPYADRWLKQSQGVKSDWRLEEEYRHRGDLNITSVPKEKLILFCRTSDEAERIEEITEITTIPFTTGSQSELL